MKRVIMSSLFLLHLSLLPKVDGAEITAPSLPPAHAPVFKDDWSWTYRATEKYYWGSSSKMVNRDYEISYRHGRLTVLRHSGTAWLEASYTGDLGFMVPTSKVIQAKTQYFQFPLKVGKKWKVNNGETGVTGIETVTTAAGTFPAFRIERRIQHTEKEPGDPPAFSNFYETFIYFYSPQRERLLSITTKTSFEVRREKVYI